MQNLSPWRAQHTFTTTGAGTLTLGSAVSPDVAFSVEMADGDTGLFAAEEFDAGTGAANGAWEIFRGTIGATGTTLTRDAVLRSSTGTSAISWAAGTKRVYALQDTDPLPLSRPPSIPGAGVLSLGRSKIAEFPFLAFKGASGLERLVQPFIGTIPMLGVTGFAGNALTSVGGIFTGSGTFGVVSTASTNEATRTPRVSATSAGTAGSLAALRLSSTSLHVGNASFGGGFFHIGVIVPTTTVSDMRTFAGLQSSTAAPTNVNPSTLTNCIGIAAVDGSANWHIVFGGSAAQTPIDLGADFPSRVGSADKIQYAFYWPPGDNGGFYYEVIRNDGAFTASGFVPNTTPGVTLPADSTSIAGLRFFTTNNATASAVRVDVSAMLTFVL